MAADIDYGEPDLAKGTVPLIARKVALSIRVDRFRRQQQRENFLGDAKQALVRLTHLCGKHHCVWLWSPDLYRTLLALGLFDLIGPGKPWILDHTSEEQKLPAKKRWSGFAVLEGRVTILVIRLVGGGILHACDTANVGLPPPAPHPKGTWSRARATLEQVENWINWLKVNDMGTLQHTISSQAFYGFRKHLPNIPVIVHNHQPSLNLERAALLGGRCEAFYLGKICDPVYHLDFASLYGWCAGNFDMPVLWNCFVPDGFDLKQRPGIGYIATVDVDIFEPMLPYRDERLKLLTFPIGRFTTTLCGPELELAAPFIRRVHQTSCYQMAPLFTVWAKRAWEARCDAENTNNKALAAQLKLFAQVLFGKFGQQKIGWRRAHTDCPHGDWEYWPLIDAMTNTSEEWRCIAGRTEKLFRGGETHDSCPAIAAWVASLARVRLWQAINTIGRDHVYYSDTDSIWTDETGYWRAHDAGLVMGTTFGSLRLVRCHRWVEFIGWKHYRTPDGLVCAGISGVERLQRINADGQTIAEPISTAARAGRAPKSVAIRSAVGRSEEYRHGLVTGHDVVPWCRKDW